MLVVVVVRRIVSRLHNPACTTRAVATSAGTEEKMLKIFEAPNLPSLTCIPDTFVAVVDGFRVGAGPGLRCFAFTVTSGRCGPCSPGTVDHAVGMAGWSAQVVGGAVRFLLGVALASLAFIIILIKFHKI